MPARSYRRFAKKKTDEVKGMDTILTLAPVIATTTTNASSFVLNLIQPGTGSWNRVGRKAHLKSARLRVTVSHSYQPVAVTGTTTGNQLRMIVVWDKQPSGAAIPTFDTIFGLTDQTGAEATTFINPIKYDNMDRFSVLRDKVVDCNIGCNNFSGTVNNVTNIYQVDEFIELKGRECVFSGQSNPMTIADVSTGALYVFFRAQVNAAENLINLLDESFCRLRYLD